MQMFGLLTAIWPAVSVLREPPDAGGAGAVATEVATAPDAGGDAGAGDDQGPIDDGTERGDASQIPAQAAGGDDDDLDALDETEYADLSHDPRIKKLLTRARKLSNRDRRATPLMQQLRAAGVEKPEQVLQLIQHARSGANVEQAIQNNPRLRAALMGGDAPEERERGRQDEQPLPVDEPFTFDESAFAAFDRSDPGTNALLGVIKTGAQRAHSQQMVLNRVINWARALERDHKELKQLVNGDRSKSAGQQWGTAVDTAAAKLPNPGLQKAFRKAVFADITIFRQRNGREPNPQDVIEGVLADFVDSGKVTSREAAKVAAGQQTIAERNRSLPRPGSMAGGQPASARVDRSNERISDVNRRLGVRTYGGR